MKTMRVAQVSRPDGPFEIVERDRHECRGDAVLRGRSHTLEFSVLAGVRSLNEVYPMARVGEAYDRMMSGQARFRVVLTM